MKFYVRSAAKPAKAHKTIFVPDAKKAQFTHERVEYNVFCLTSPLKALNHLKSLKLARRFVLTSCDIYQNPFTQEKILKF
jgi:hypothetical protein